MLVDLIIIITQMSTNSLLLSLLPNQSNGFRTSSLSSRTALSPQFSFYQRSSSSNHHLNDRRSPPVVHTAQHWTPLLKMGHLLNVKIKKTCYFVFCKLDQYRKAAKSSVTATCEIPVCEQAHTDPNKSKGERISKGLVMLGDCYQTLKSKVAVREERNLVNLCFGSIKMGFLKYRSLEKAFGRLNRIRKERIQLFLRAIERQERDKMRNQILAMSIEQPFRAKLQQAFIALKQCEGYSVRNSMVCSVAEQELTSASGIHFMQHSYRSSEAISQYSTQNEYEQTMKFSQPEMFTERNMLSERTNRSKKIILREKKMLPSQPLQIPTSKITKAVKLNLQADFGLSVQQTSFNSGNEFMIRIPNQKQQIFTQSIPDLNDNHNLFSQISQPVSNRSSTDILTSTSYLICLTESKQSTELVDIDSCFTERNRPVVTQRKNSNDGRRTPSYSKHKSSGNIPMVKSNQIESGEKDTSPLVKIDQILNKIEQMKSYNSEERTSREKRTVHVNLPKDFYDSSNRSQNKQRQRTITTKTPLKERKDYQLGRYRSNENQKLGQRPFNEKDKLSSYKKCTNFELQSAGKYKSTILKGKSKNDKQQLFTARKMKMEIENLISRRNKQLNFRTDSSQLK